MKRLKQFTKWMKGNLLIFNIAIVLLIGLQYFRTLTPLFVTHIVDSVFGNEESVLPGFIENLVQANTIQKQLLLVAVVFVLFTLFRVLIMFGRRLINAVFTENIAYNMRNTLYDKLQNLSFTYHSHAETGDLIQRCTTDVETYRVFIGEQLIEVFRLLFLIGFAIFQMNKLSPTMTLYAIIITPIIFLTSLIYFMLVKKHFKIVEEAEGSMTTTLQESVTGIRVVKAFASEQHEIDKFDKKSMDYYEKDYTLLKLMAIYWGSTDFVIFIQYAFTLSFGIYFTTEGVITLGTFIAFLTYIGMVVWPLRRLGRIVGDFGKTTVALDRLDEIMDKVSEHDNDAQNTPKIEGDIQFKNVSFTFEDASTPLLNDVSFSVKKGETLAIVGKTGSGKSTLTNLLIRLLEIDDGEILIDGKNIQDINKKHLRKHIGIIMQEPFLYSRTLQENIGIMNENAPTDKIHQAASIAALHDDVQELERGYNTIVGERGVTLSGGQKQRVAIARMLIDSKPVLIFDDSLSAVDTETDIQIRNALDEYWQDTTVFIITHRITTAMEADKIIVLEEGKVKEMGTHKQLLKNKGLYSELWDIQTNIEYDYEKIKEGVR
ncbi:MAG: ABC transporter ATP-binding protein/permease [Candidatus Izimaplasma sp.]|nr:ABC transporter ATP-binding protein/permease [Candidatus Izimaplasma bacterium]